MNRRGDMIGVPAFVIIFQDVRGEGEQLGAERQSDDKSQEDDKRDSSAFGRLTAHRRGSDGLSRPPTRTGSMRLASPLALVWTNTPQSVAGPPAGL